MDVDCDKFMTESHALWTRNGPSMRPIERHLDNILRGYVYYPEFEWPIYNVRPPDSHSLIASWRKTNGAAFIFLLGVRQQRHKDHPSYLLIVVGLQKEVRLIHSMIGTHKLDFARHETRVLAKASAGEVLDVEAKAKSAERFAKVIGIFTVIVNAFSLYLRKLQIPSGISAEFRTAYEYLVLSVHFSALFLLLLIVLISIIYTARYGFMMLRRMR